MHIWVGIDVDSQLRAVKEAARQAEQALGFAHSNFTLPLHVSLKMSFPVDEKIADQVIDDLTEFYGTVDPFPVRVQGIEKWDTIVWIRMAPCGALDTIHDRLNGFLSEKYGVGLYPYDLDYRFHTTLFMDDDREKIDRAYDAVKEVPVPAELRMSRFLIGASPSGALGTYRVLRLIER